MSFHIMQTTDQQEIQAAHDRTDSKLRYAALHLSELEVTERRGGDFERAHQEAFLFQLHGVSDAFLQELNLRYACGLSVNKVRRDRLEKRIRQQGKQSKSLEQVAALEDNPVSWLSQMKEMRDHSTHRHAVPRDFHVGGPLDCDVYLRDTRTGQLVEKDYLALFREWLGAMETLIPQLRELEG